MYKVSGWLALTSQPGRAALLPAIEALWQGMEHIALAVTAGWSLLLPCMAMHRHGRSRMM
jgi:hypothetical protein